MKLPSTVCLSYYYTVHVLIILDTVPFTAGGNHAMSPWNDGALAALTEKLKLNVVTNTGLTDKLERAADGFMDRGEAQKVREQPIGSEQMDMIIKILRGKDDEAFCKFCKILCECNYSHWADELKRKAGEIREVGRGLC